jgi:hypothetical protein
MLLPRRLSLTQLAVGAVASLIIVKVARPLLVGVVRAGFEVKDLAADTWTKAKNEVADVKAEARVKPDAVSPAVIADLQAQIQSLKTQLASKKA